MDRYCTHRASVPYTYIHMGVRYCHHCRAWSLGVWSASWTNDEDAAVHYAIETDAGPFDTVADVVVLAAEQLAAAMLTPGSPWDPCPASPYEPVGTSRSVINLHGGEPQHEGEDGQDHLEQLEQSLQTHGEPSSPDRPGPALQLPFS